MKIIHVVNKVTSESIPVEVANHIGQEKNSSKIISLYDNTNEINNEIISNRLRVEIILLGLKRNNLILNLFKFRRLITREKPDILHIHHTYVGVLVIFMKFFFMWSPKIITTVHNDIRYFKKLQRIIWILLIRNSNMVICNSENTKAVLQKYKFLIGNNKKLRVIYNGVDIKKIKQYSKKNKNANSGKKDFILINVAMLFPQKDQETLIRGFQLFNEEFPETKLIIIGEGLLKNKLKSLVQILGLENSVTFTGLLSRVDVYRLLSTADLFVMTSIYEGFCNAMVEAMVVGMPIIASKVDPLPEVIGHNNGLLFEVGNAFDLSSKMKKLYNDIILRDMLAANSQKYAISKYSIENTVQGYINSYYDIIYGE